MDARVKPRGNRRIGGFNYPRFLDREQHEIEAGIVVMPERREDPIRGLLRGLEPERVATQESPGAWIGRNGIFLAIGDRRQQAVLIDAEPRPAGPCVAAAEPTRAIL